MSETSRKAALWVALIFVLGMALGGVLGYTFAHRSYAASVQAPQTDAAKRAQRLEHLSQELSLTPDQRAQIDVILGDVLAQYKTIRDSTNPQINEARQKGRARIRAVLTPEQLQKFEAFLQRLDAERKKNPQQ